MSLPGVTETYSDGALGLAQPASDNARCFLGTCSAGTDATLYGPYYDSTTARGELGYGPLVSALCASLDQAGGPVWAVPLNKSTAGACGSVTLTGTGTATLAASGAAYDAFAVTVEIMAGGATLVANTATFRYTLDGLNYSDIIAVPTGGVYVVPNTGITLTWTYSSGTAFVAGDVYTFSTTAPGFGATQYNAGMTTLLADAQVGQMSYCYLVGMASSASASATIASAVASKMDASETQHTPLFTIMEAAADTSANLRTQFQSFSDKRVVVAAGTAKIQDGINGARLPTVSVGRVFEIRVAQTSVEVAQGWIGDPKGPLPLVSSLVSDLHTTLDAERFTTIYQVPGKTGFYVCHGQTMAAVGSDYGPLQNLRVVDKAARLARARALGFVQQKVATVASTGYLTEAQALSIENAILAAVRPMIDAGEAEAVGVTVKRDENVVSTQNLTITLRITPWGYPNTIVLDLGFAAIA